MLYANMMTHPAQFSRETEACVAVVMLLQHHVTVTGSASILLAFKLDPLFTLHRRMEAKLGEIINFYPLMLKLSADERGDVTKN